jgi:hypothetical protein
MAPPAEMSPECRARCDTDIASRLMCIAGHAAVTVFSSAEREQGEQLRASLARNFGQVLNLEHGAAPLLQRAAEGLSGSYQTLGDSEVPGRKRAKFSNCLDAAQKKREASAERLEAFTDITAHLFAATRN